MVLAQGTGTPIQAAATAAETYYEGKLLMTTSNAMTVITADESITVAVTDQSSVDAEGTALAKASGDKIGVWPLGCGKIVKVYSADAQTYTVGCLVVNSDSVDGACELTSGSTGDNIIGTYWGAGETTTADGDLIDVLLNVMPDLADHS